jgi:hypothetical protein
MAAAATASLFSRTRLRELVANANDELPAGSNRALEDYLRQIDACLKGLPPRERREALRELRGHIIEASQSHETGDLPASEALSRAIAQFGEPAAIGKGFSDAWRRGQAADLRSGIGMLLCGVAIVLALRIVYTYSLIHLYVHAVSAPRLWQGLWFGAGYSWLDFAAIVLAGGLIGRVSPRHALLVSLLTIPLIAIYGWAFDSWLTLHPQRFIIAIPYHGIPSFVVRQVQLALGLAPCFATAWLVSRRRLTKRLSPIYGGWRAGEG